MGILWGLILSHFIYQMYSYFENIVLLTTDEVRHCPPQASLRYNSVNIRTRKKVFSMLLSDKSSYYPR